MSIPKINFNPTPDEILDAVDDTQANLSTLFREARGGSNEALVLYTAYQDYLDERPQAAVWLVHFRNVYLAAKGQVRS